LTWSQKAEWLRDNSRDTGKLSPALASKPELFPDLFEIWNAFWTLSPSRTMGFGSIGFVPLAEIKTYIDMHDVSDPEFFLQCIREMDLSYVKWQEENQESKSNADR
jgi:hypothetical protein